jgi:hypothetical protein
MTKSLLKIFQADQEVATEFMGSKLAAIIPALLVTVKSSVGVDVDTEAIADALNLP